jgi:hypothetical protein
MPSFEEQWRDANHQRVGKFSPFGLVNNELWAPSWINDRWEVFDLDYEIARQAALNVLCLGIDSKNIVSFFTLATAKSRPRSASHGA